MPSWQKLPALRTLRIFEAAARHLNYTRAAGELHLTHGAVSHQIKALEAELGTALFAREGKRTRLTEAGQQLADGVRDCLDGLAGVVTRVRERSAGHIFTLSVLPSFAAGWLVARLGDFLAQHPGVELNLQSTSALADFRSDGVDAAIRYGGGRWPGLACEKLLDDEVFPVASPAFVRRHRLTRPEQLLHLPLVRSTWQSWQRWFAAAGLSGSDAQAGPTYSDAELTYQAAVRGQGVALGRSSLVTERIEQGLLVAPFDLRVPSANAYYLVYPEASLKKAAFVQFRGWLLHQLATAAPSTPPRPPSEP
jgi:LysR family glycine cleavage system transcriptional activator